MKTFLPSISSEDLKPSASFDFLPNTFSKGNRNRDQKNTDHLLQLKSPNLCPQNLTPNLPLKSMRNYSGSITSSFFKTERSFSDRSKFQLDQVIKDCGAFQSNLVNLWKDVRRNLPTRSLSTDTEKDSEKWRSEFQYLNAKRKSDEITNVLSNGARNKNYRKIKSIIELSEEPFASTDSMLRLVERREFITREDIVNQESKKLLSINKRGFGQKFESEFKHPNQSSTINLREKIRKLNVSPEETVLADIKEYRRQDSMINLKPEHIKAVPIMKNKKLIIDEESFLDRLNGSNSIQKLAINELFKFESKGKNTIIKKKQAVIEAKIKRFEEKLQKLEEETQNPPDAGPKTENKLNNSFQRRVINMRGILITKRSNKQDLELMNILKQEKIDAKTASKIHKIMKEKEHKKMIKLI